MCWKSLPFILSSNKMKSCFRSMIIDVTQLLGMMEKSAINESRFGKCRKEVFTQQLFVSAGVSAARVWLGRSKLIVVFLSQKLKTAPINVVDVFCGPHQSFNFRIRPACAVKFPIPGFQSSSSPTTFIFGNFNCHHLSWDSRWPEDQLGKDLFDSSPRIYNL